VAVASILCRHNRNIAQRKLAEDALRESKERLNRVLDNSRDGINMLLLRWYNDYAYLPIKIGMIILRF